MRFHVGRVPPNPDFHPKRDGWRRMNEPSDGAFISQATLYGVIAAIAFSYWLSSLPSSDPDAGRIVINTSTITLIGMLKALAILIGGFIALVIVHESIHLLLHPGFGFTKDSIAGIIPRWGAFYACYDNAITRNRFLLMVAAPFVILSVIPAIIASFIGQPPLWLSMFIIINALFSGGDITSIGLFLKATPSHALLRQQAWEFYWRPRE